MEGSKKWTDTNTNDDARTSDRIDAKKEASPCVTLFSVVVVLTSQQSVDGIIRLDGRFLQLHGGPQKTERETRLKVCLKRK